VIKRRDFIKISAGVFLSSAFAGRITMANRGIKTKVSLVKTSDRATGIKRAIDILGINPVRGKNVLLKPNFNTADPFPASTHNDTLTHLILHYLSF
jgi:hypothetical protein